MTRQVTLATLEEQNAALPILGFCVSWRFRGIQVEHADLKQRLTTAGFGAFLPKPPTARTALRRAILAWNAERVATGHSTAISSGATDVEDSGNGKAQRALIRVINSKRTTHLAFLIVAEDIDLQAFGVSYGTDITIKLNKTSGDLSVMTQDSTGATTDSPAIAQALQPYWVEQRNLHTSGDVSRIVRAIVGTFQAVNLRDGGGFYFVPASERDALMRLRTFVTALPIAGDHEPFMLVLPQPDIAAGRQQLAKASHAGFMDELAAMATDLDRFVQAERGTVKPETISERLVAFKHLRTKAEAYAELLGMRQERIFETLDALTRKAKSVVVNIAADDDASETEGGEQEPEVVEDHESSAMLAVSPMPQHSIAAQAA